MQTIKDRVLEFIKAEEISVKRFETRASLSNGAVSKMGDNTRRKILDKIVSAYPQLNMNWLLTGEGEMLSKNEPKPEISYTDGVPYYDEMFECGFNELVAPNSESPEYLIKMPGYEKATLWCNASGASMEPEISNGDIIAMRRIEDFSFLPYGDIYAFITSNGMRTIKRLGRSSDPTCYRLIPTNKEYDEQDIPKSMIQIVYRVLGAMKAF
jgi:phage repressor protein C with HTH and peptisase S24 domain